MVAKKQNKKTEQRVKEDNTDKEKTMKLDSVVLDIITTKPQLVQLLDKFNIKYHEPVSVNTYHRDKKMIIARTQDPPSNPNSVYAILTVKPKGIVCEFYPGNQTFDYINKLYARLSGGEIKWLK
jgi:hypothetical protein